MVNGEHESNLILNGQILFLCPSYLTKSKKKGLSSQIEENPAHTKTKVPADHHKIQTPEQAAAAVAGTKHCHQSGL